MEWTIGRWRIQIEAIQFDIAELKRRYDRLAYRWQHTINRLGFDKAYAGLFAEIANSKQLNSLTKDAKVLDCGIGSGDLSLALLKNLPSSVHIHGLDISSAMLGNCRERFNRQGYYLETYQLPLETFHQTNDHFDLVMSAHLLEHLDDTETGLKKQQELLKAGGQLLVVATRPGLISAWLNFGWRLNTVPQQQMIGMLRGLGMQHVTAVPLGGSSFCKRMSYAVLATK